jgi:membrane-bound lytic murein transglycosylase MltF
MTMTDELTAGLWAKVFPELRVYDQMPLVEDDRIGWAVQNGSKNFLALINEFVKDHKQGTTFGNVVLANYLQTTQWAKNNTAPGEMEKYKAAVAFFKKYGETEGFDWRLIAAQAYQESQIDQSKVSPAGAVGVMQIKPSTAADNPINVNNVDTSMEKNIQAGAKYLKYMDKRYFSDPAISSLDQALFAFASYNAGPAKIAKLRELAEKEGLNRNKWFGNVELVAAHEIGSETVTYVSNIYKYYVAYKVASETSHKRKNFMR